MTFARLMNEAVAADGLPATGDVLAVGLPLLRQLEQMHREGAVSTLRGVADLVYDGRTLSLPSGSRQAPRRAGGRVDRIDPSARSGGIEVTARYHVDHGAGPGLSGRSTSSLDVFDPVPGAQPDRPQVVPGYQAWEQFYGHHDQLTDVHVAGLVLVSYATGLDLDLLPAVQELALSYRHLLGLNPLLHPVVAGVLTDMLQPSRHRRPRDLAAVVARLEHHRDVPADLDLDDAYKAPEGWQRAVLAVLRERVFDVSRRNRALYFRPTNATVSLTDASVPLLLDVERIKPDDLLTWTGSAAAAFRSGKPVDLERWCRFEEAPHLAPSLDTLISNERRLRAEHGEGRLRLIIAFLRWVDPATGETVNSPLLTMSAELTRKKGVRDRYRVQVDGPADVNPVLRHVFGNRFGVDLPERIETDGESIAALVRSIEAGVKSTDPSVRIELVDVPRVSLIRRRAELRVDAYWRRRAQAAATTGRWRRQDHSYDHDDWRPLGLALYRRFVRPSDLPLRHLAGAGPRPRPPDAFAATREATSYSLTSDVHRHRWEVDLCAVTLASLGTRRTSLSRDYETVLDHLDQRGATDVLPAMAGFEAIFSPDPRSPAGAAAEPIDIDLPLVLPADDAQARAIRRCLRGDSIIVQGPPGTGKSQTITNLIAAMIADGKRVLFVCEKRAALDVVAQRLRQAGLGELVATIHDSQLDRRAFIADLSATYDRWLDGEPDGREVARGQSLERVRSILEPLERVYLELTDERGDRLAVATLVERLVGLRVRSVDGGATVPDSLRVTDWDTARRALDAVVQRAAAAGHQGPLSRLACLHLQPIAVGEDDPVVSARRAGADLREAARLVLDALVALPGADAVGVGAFRATLEVLPTIAGLRRCGATAVLDRQSGAHLDLRAAAHAVDAASDTVGRASSVEARWNEALSGTDARAALDLARAKEGSAFKFLSGPWRKVKALVEQRYRFDQHQVRPTITSVLTDLVAWRDAEDARDALRREFAVRYGADDPRALLDLLDRNADHPIVAWIGRGAAVDVDALQGAAERLDAALRHVLVSEAAPLGSLIDVGSALERTSAADEGVLVAWSALSSASPSVLATLTSTQSTPDEIERAVLERELARAGHGEVGSRLPEIDATVDELLDGYRDLLRANAGMIGARARQQFLDHVAQAEASMAGRSEDDKAFKRAYNAGRKVLEREFQKTMRHRAIRELASGESGIVVRDLKPVWLMSPLSVSDTLPLDGDTFDVVVFDEASQIPVEDAVPSLFRAPQLVVVGDRMQLPPTRFFAAGDSADDDDGVLVDADGHNLTITLDADSFLTQADLALPPSMLTWHYRSRSESLIAYSNHAFYGGRLATVPDRAFEESERGAIEVESPSDAVANLPALLDRPISFHRVRHGVYEQRRNEAEADYIAEMVRALLARDAGNPADALTIGVVAFSEAQQGAIESSLAELATIDPAFGTLLEEAQLRTVDGEFVGLFVKNLENVQGDERDVIILSVCYAPDANGKMRMNFGPINQAGGERRLNVIFSRAKSHMAVVSTIDSTAITNTYNDGAAHLARFLAYAEGESRGGVGGDAVLSALGSAEGASSAIADRSAVATELADALRSRGFPVDTHIGRSGFRIDIAIRGAGGYRLGVLVEPGLAKTSATARAIAEASVLKAFGWPVTRVLVTEWWSRPDSVVARIERLLGAEGTV